ncbi:hypothetical protein J6590_040807 [Homalodisca vitripennis]|nr:hypothetical protein J6590_040807 [Homalodisca vitripennis]
MRRFMRKGKKVRCSLKCCNKQDGEMCERISEGREFARGAEANWVQGRGKGNIERRKGVCESYCSRLGAGEGCKGCVRGFLKGGSLREVLKQIGCKGEVRDITRGEREFVRGSIVNGVQGRCKNLDEGEENGSKSHINGM